MFLDVVTGWRLCNMRKKEFHIPSPDQLEEFMDLAELGKQAKILFHDLANHFTTLNLTIRELENNLSEERDRIRDYSKKSLETRSQIEYVANLLRSHMQADKEPYILDKIIREIIDLYNDRTKSAGITIKTNLSKNIRFTNGKRDFIHVVTNLFGNAIEAIDGAQHKKIRIELKENKCNIILSISDTGRGISKTNHHLIFKNGFTTKKHGHGIGLSAVKEKVESTFNGKIFFLSGENGTRFTVSIPKQNRKHFLLPVSKDLKPPKLLSFESLRERTTV